MYTCPGLLLLLLLRVIGGGQDVDWVNNVIKVVIFLIWKAFRRHKATITVTLKNVTECHCGKDAELKLSQTMHREAIGSGL